MAIERPEEAILDGLKDHVKDNLDTYLTQIETETTDGISLVDIRDHRVGEYSVEGLNSFPALLYFPEDIGYAYLTTKSEEITISINGILVVREAIKENAVRRLLRYVAGLRALWDNDRTAGGVVDRVSITEVRFFAHIPGVDDRALAEVIMTATKEIQR